jgi:hypothetical protein
MAMRCADAGTGGSKDGKRGKPVDGAEPGALAAKPAQQELHDEKTREYERKTGTESRDERGEKQQHRCGEKGDPEGAMGSIPGCPERASPGKKELGCDAERDERR